MADLGNETYLTVKEIAAQFRVSEMSIYRLIEKGKLHSVKIGNQIRISQSALDEYLAQGSS